MATYPAADQSRRYDALFDSRYTGGPPKGVLHTTETTGLPGYDSGKRAPHFTLVPNVATKTVRIYQHFDTGRPSRALTNADGGVQTNKDHAVQIELVGTCSRAFVDAHPAAVYWPRAPRWLLDELRVLMRWIERAEGVARRRSSKPLLPYPQRTMPTLSAAEWDSSSFWCGHQNAPENVNQHGDPGDVDLDYLLADDATVPADTTPIPSEEDTDMPAPVIINITSAAGEPATAQAVRLPTGDVVVLATPEEGRCIERVLDAPAGDTLLADEIRIAQGVLARAQGGLTVDQVRQAIVGAGVADDVTAAVVASLSKIRVTVE